MSSNRPNNSVVDRVVEEDLSKVAEVRNLTPSTSVSSTLSSAYNSPVLSSTSSTPLMFDPTLPLDNPTWSASEKGTFFLLGYMRITENED